MKQKRRKKDEKEMNIGLEGKGENRKEGLTKYTCASHKLVNARAEFVKAS